uniref:Phosphoribosyltransferase n=1 Tax=Acrochaetium secundatum TaxID=209631 RepID=A0A4D6BM97_9FLOR|nr:Phosphoribosyltransferase [Acrochaetium secundatum]QBX88358.1 Phosphoribosyltransferase [Acrochaetium secundatum]
MSISIYTIKHPLALSWHSCLLQGELNNFEEFDLVQKIVLALIYEASRKFIHINKIYWKKINSLDIINLLDNDFAYCIITSTYITQIAGKKILSILPKSKIYSETPQKYDLENLCNNYKLSIYNIKIILIEDLLRSTIVTHILNLMSDLNIATQNLQICCISCSSNTLENLNLTCHDLNIYTVKLLNS